MECLVQDFEDYLWLGSLLETFYLMRHERQSKATTTSINVASSGISLSEVSYAPICWLCSTHSSGMTGFYYCALSFPNINGSRRSCNGNPDMKSNPQELDAHLTNWAQLLGDRYGFVTGKSCLP